MRLQKIFEFTEWCAKNYQMGEHRGEFVWFINQQVSTLTTEDLYKIWKDELKRTPK